MLRILTLVSLLFFFALPVGADGFRTPMSFRVALNGGNCATCTWIAAEGVIQSDTPQKFQHFAKALIVKPGGIRSFDGVNIHLNSPGGNLLAGVSLGKIFRELKVNTVVSASKTREIWSGGEHLVESSDPQVIAECSSACVFAFVGGVVRYASQNTLQDEVGFQPIGRLGVHQFYNPRALAEPAIKSLTAGDAIGDQKIVSHLLAHLSEMGVSAELLQISSATEPTMMHYLTTAEIERTRLDTWAVRDLFIRGYKNGVAIVELQYARKGGDYRIELYCDKGILKMLVGIVWRGLYDVDGHREWKFFKNLTITDATQPNDVRVRLIEEQFANANGVASGKFRFEFEGATLKRLVRLKNFTFSDGSSHWASDAARELVFSLPFEFDGLYLLPRACKK